MPDSATSGHKLSNPPVVYVLAQVRFNALLSMEKYIPEIQERCRKIYPKFRKGVVQNLEFDADGQPREVIKVHRWEFFNKEGTEGFILHNDSFVFHSSKYKDFESFIDMLVSMLSEVNEVIDVSLIERLGLRYIDVIAPDDGECINDYLNPGLSGLPYEELGVELSASHFDSVSKSSLGQLVIRTTKNYDAANIPQDLFPVSLKIENPAKQGTLSALLDSDHYCEKSRDYDIDDIRKCFIQLQDLLSKAFWSSITEFAVNKWR